MSSKEGPATILVKNTSMSLASLCEDILRVVLATLTFERVRGHRCKPANVAQKWSPFETEKAFPWATMIDFFVGEAIKSYLVFHQFEPHQFP